MRDAGWLEAMLGVDAVMHVAAQILADEPKDPQVVIGPAVEGTERVLRYAIVAGVKRVVMTSSIATVGYGHGQTSGKRTYTEGRLHQSRRHEVHLGLLHRQDQGGAGGLGLCALRGPGTDHDPSRRHPGPGAGRRCQHLAGHGHGPAGWHRRRPCRATAFRSSMCATWPPCMWRRCSSRSRSASAIWRRPTICRSPRSAASCAAAYPDRQITQKIVPDWIIKLLARFGGPTRQIINDIGNEKHYSRREGRGAARPALHFRQGCNPGCRRERDPAGAAQKPASSKADASGDGQYRIAGIDSGPCIAGLAASASTVGRRRMRQAGLSIQQCR